VADEVIDRRVGHGRFDVVEAEVADQAAHIGLVQTLGCGQRDPAHLLLAQTRFEAPEVTHRKARQIDYAGADEIRLEHA
jgi:hypothetical protein